MNQFKQLCMHMIIIMDYAQEDYVSALLSVLDCSQADFEELQIYKLHKIF